MKTLRWAQSNILLIVPILVAVGFYSWQGVLGLWTLEKPYLAGRMAGIMLLAVVVFALAYFAMPVDWVNRFGLSRLNRKHLNILCISAVAVYALILAVSVVTADNVAFFSAFAGCSADDLAEFRETFLRTREGMGQALNYLYVICNNSIMPLAVTYAFWAQKRWRFVALAVFVFGLSLTLQKGNVLSAGLPLIALYLISASRIADLRKALPAGAMIVSAVAGMYLLAGGHAPHFYAPTRSCSEASVMARAESQQPSETGLPTVDGARSVSQVPPKYNITGSDSQISLLANRVLWIPYITAIDWLRYQEDVLDGHLVWGRSIKPVALLAGQDPINLEREVARMQWGQNAQGTASSNAIYAVDAWVNFGIGGVIGYAALFGFTVRMISRAGLPPLTAAAIVPVYTAGFVGLPPVFLSGGLGVILIVSIILKPVVQDKC